MRSVMPFLQRCLAIPLTKRHEHISLMPFSLYVYNSCWRLGVIIIVIMGTDKKLTEVENYVTKAIMAKFLGFDGDTVYHPLYKAWDGFRHNPQVLSQIQNYESFGKGMLMFLSFGTINDVDTQQQIASIAYLFTSKAIQISPNNINLYKDRLLLMMSQRDVFKYTISSALHAGERRSILSPYFSVSQIEDRTAACRMEYADLSVSDRLCDVQIFANRKRELEHNLSHGQIFNDGETIGSIIQDGKLHHNKVLAYLENKVLVQCNIDF